VAGDSLKLSLLARVFWAAGFLGHAALLITLTVRRRYEVVPWFSTWIAYGLVYTLALFTVYRMGSNQLYAKVYWFGAFVELLLQVSVVLEVAQYVFRRGGSWVEGAKSRLLIIGMCALCAALILGWQMKPAAASKLDALVARVDLSTTVLITVLFTGVMLVSQQLGLSWRNLVLREGYGLMIWAIVSFITDTLHAYWRTVEHFNHLEDVRMLVYLGALVYWTIVFSLPEAGPKMADTSTRRQLEQLRRSLD
jgi:hypothetical protein